MAAPHKKITSEEAAERGRKGGQKKKAVTYYKERVRKRLAKEADKEAENILHSLKDSAYGHYYEVRAEDGTLKRVYKRSPNPQALNTWFDRAFGKPKQEMEHSGEVGHYDLSEHAKELEQKYQQDSFTVASGSTADTEGGSGDVDQADAEG